MANVDNPHGFIAERVNGGTGAIPLEEDWLTSNVTIAAGDALIWTSGRLDVALATSAQIAGVAAHAVTGVAATLKKLLYVPAQENIIFSGQCDSTSPVTLVGTGLSIVGATGVMELDSSDTDPGVCQIVGLKPGSEWGTNSEVLFVWRDSLFTGQS